MKICSRCKINKEFTEFVKDKNNKLGVKYECKACHSIAKKTVRGRYARYKEKSKRFNLLFSLTLEEFDNITQLSCFYCGEYNYNGKTNGIDRVDNNVGYVLGNCVPCCRFCNVSKSNFTQKEFIRKCKLIVEKNI